MLSPFVQKCYLKCYLKFDMQNVHGFRSGNMWTQRNTGDGMQDGEFQIEKKLQAAREAAYCL
jgi:hypothetical protein